MKITIETLVLVIASINGLFFFGIALSKSRSDPANYYLAFLMLFCSIIFYDEFSRYTPAFFLKYPHLTMVFTFPWFLILPLIYFLVRYLITKNGLTPRDIFHLLPLLAANLFNNYYEPIQERIFGLEQNLIRPEPHGAKLIFAFQIILYLILVYQRVKSEYGLKGWTLIRSLNGWVKILGLLLLSYLLMTTTVILMYELGGVFLKWVDFTKTYLFLIVIYGWLYFTIYHPGKLSRVLRATTIWEENGIVLRSSRELKQVIEEIVEKQWHLDTTLTVHDLAILLRIPYRRLIKLVQEDLDLSLYQLITLLRIKEMESRYLDPAYRNYSLVGLAQSAGFTSKSSLYRSFRNFSSLTPASYFNHFIKNTNPD